MLVHMTARAEVSDACRVLKSTEGASVALSNYEGKKPVVLFFYPRVSEAPAHEKAQLIALLDEG